MQQLRELSGGKPIGFKLCVGQPHEFAALCHAMLDANVAPDFVTVDGTEGGTGAAPPVAEREACAARPEQRVVQTDEPALRRTSRVPLHPSSTSASAEASPQRSSSG